MLVNQGYWIQQPMAADYHKPTFVIVGLGRSGTSILASMFDFLNIPLGDTATEATNEDQRLAAAMEKRDDALIEAVISDYNAKHETWGFKRPSMLVHAKNVLPRLRNPVLIYTHRDFLSIGIRNLHAINRPIPDSLKKCLDAYAKQLTIMEEFEHLPSIHYSFSLLKDKPEVAIKSLMEFTGIGSTKEESLDEFLADKFYKYHKTEQKT